MERKTKKSCFIFLLAGSAAVLASGMNDSGGGDGGAAILFTGVDIGSSYRWLSDGVVVSETLDLLRLRWIADGGGGGDFWKGIGEAVVRVRASAVAPVMWAAIWLSMAASVMVLVDVLWMGAVSLGLKLFRRTPERRYGWEALGGDAEAGSLAYPMVLVQIPMFNEKEVYKLSIGAACGLSWPSDRIIIQVLDDSTDPIIKALVEIECKAWASKGMNITYELRGSRKGFKAGALKEGMVHSYVQECEFVAIFDSDFQPEADFLMRTIPFLVHNPKIALVQARWDFVNYNECLMTRIQKISLDYHFKVEQEAGSSTFAFFGFNGTAGVWRIAAINEAGGWKDRTVVEDMDLAVRASLTGWDFVYVNDIRVKSELPSAFNAYRCQQFRWTSGAANLFRKMAADVMATKEISLCKKIHIIYSFFFVRKVVSHIVTFLLYCIIIPVSALVPEVSVPTWGVVYVPTTISILNAIRNPRSIHLMPLWILFENVMSMHKFKAALSGLFELGRVNEWVVTEKHGDDWTGKSDIQLLENPTTKFCKRFHTAELCFSFFLFLCASYDLKFGGHMYFIYIYFQAIAFFVMGFGLVGKESLDS